MVISDLIKEVKINKNKLNINIDSIIIEQNQQVVSMVFNDVNLHELRSCTKLLTAFSVGILIENKKLSLDTKVYTLIKDLIPYISENNLNKIKAWTIKTLLTHSTGYSKMMLDRKSLQNQKEEDVFASLFTTHIENTPNKDFTYNNVEPYLLSIIIQKITGESLEEFVKREIFDKLSIKNYIWNKYNGYTLGNSGLYLNYLDFHKIAKLLMNYGKYNNLQIVPNNWVKEMIKPQIDCVKNYKPERVFPKVNAGYFTFISRDNIVFRDGSNGQYIICDYRNNILISLMASESDMSKETEIFRDLI